MSSTFCSSAFILYSTYFSACFISVILKFVVNPLTMDPEIAKNGVDTMSKDERKVYDRQIRLWGYEGQNK